MRNSKIGSKTKGARNERRETNQRDITRACHELAQYLFPNGKRAGPHWCVGDIPVCQGNHSKSVLLAIRPVCGATSQFAKAFSKLARFVDAARNIDFKTALREAAEWCGHSLNGPNGTAIRPPASTLDYDHHRPEHHRSGRNRVSRLSTGRSASMLSQKNTVNSSKNGGATQSNFVPGSTRVDSLAYITATSRFRSTTKPAS